MRFAARTDANHAAIRTAFRKLLGDENVVDTSKCGNGLGDLCITYGGLVMLIEVKTATGTLTQAQQRCKLPQRLVRTMDDVAESVRVLKCWSVTLMGMTA